MIYQALTPADVIAERAFLDMRRAHEGFYDALLWNRDALAEGNDVMIYATTNMLNIVRNVVTETEMNYANLSRYCEHRYTANEHGDYICARCHKHSVMRDILAKLYQDTSHD